MAPGVMCQAPGTARTFRWWNRRLLTEGEALAVQGLADRAFLFRPPGNEFDAPEAFPAEPRDFFRVKIVAEMS